MNLKYEEATPPFYKQQLCAGIVIVDQIVLSDIWVIF
jgi:hypothetical protein